MTPENEYVAEKVLDIICEEMGFDKQLFVTRTDDVYNRKLTDFGMDSLDCLAVLMNIEKTLRIKIPESCAADIYTINDFIKYATIERKIQQKTNTEKNTDKEQTIQKYKDQIKDHKSKIQTSKRAIKDLQKQILAIRKNKAR